ncbi:mucin-17-like [Echinops telfairi]|uniref:Mucin-17-like n=1 Tax=Echinops telfairi TaxID=9371 RepID=A0AC55CL81_ECHTE|nr:mucin-17-like [Echinops telfairi]
MSTPTAGDTSATTNVHTSLPSTTHTGSITPGPSTGGTTGSQSTSPQGTSATTLPDTDTPETTSPDTSWPTITGGVITPVSTPTPGVTSATSHPDSTTSPNTGSGSSTGATPSPESSAPGTSVGATMESGTTPTVGGSLDTTLPETTTLVSGTMTSAPTPSGNSTPVTSTPAIPTSSEVSTFSTVDFYPTSAVTSAHLSPPTTTSVISTPGPTTAQTSQPKPDTPSAASTTRPLPTVLMSTTTVMPPTTTPPSVHCQNGGIWEEGQCKCTLAYYGTRCELVRESIEIEPPPATISAQVELSVKVTNQEFTEQLNDKSSPQFQKFNETFTEQMNIAYSGIPEYAGVNITRLRSGSVVVDHEVLLRANFTPEYKEVLETVAKKVEEKITNITKIQIGNNVTCTALLCFNYNDTEVKNLQMTQYDPLVECREKVGKELAQHFFVEYRGKKPYCITACMPGFNGSRDCHSGKCQLERSGPRCYCLTTDTHWYRGETCDVGIQKRLVYGLVGAAGVMLLVVFAVILVFMFRSKREVQRQKSKVSHLYKWHEENSEVPGTFQNIGFDINEEQEEPINLDSIYSKFQPSLSHIDPETKIQTERPHVVMTSM